LDADEEVRLLLEDLDKFAKSDEFNYLLGSIITYPNKDGSHAVVDGQQRSITLYLLIIALKDVLAKKLETEFSTIDKAPEGFKVLFQTLDSLIRKVSIESKAQITLPIFMEYGEGNHMLAALALRSKQPENPLTASQINILAAYEKCRDTVNDKYPSAKEIAEFARAVINGTFLVETNVGDQRQALDIFFKMNARGKDLDSSDYLKNYIFQHLSVDKYDEMSDKWANMSKALRSADSNRAKLKTPEFFLRNWAIMHRGEKISGDDGVWEYWHDQMETNPDYLKEFLEKLEPLALVFSRITSNKLVRVNKENREMIGADYFKGTQYLPVLLAGAHLDNFEYLSSIVNFRYLVYILAQEKNQDFETLVPRWAKAISFLKPNASIVQINSVLHSVEKVCLDKATIEVLRVKLQDLAMPKDERKIRAVLAIAAMQVNDKYVDLSIYLQKYKISKKSGFDVDCILNDDEIRKVMSDWDEIEYRQYMCIGNVALVNYQAKHFANKRPVAKEELYGSDTCPLTQGLSSHPEKHDDVSFASVKKFREICKVDLSTFDLSQIIMRRDAIIELFIQSIPGSLIKN
jgi:uncharacterized protein with ParB-like and HNH nuclease domain